MNGDLYRLVIVDDEFEIRQGLSSYFPWSELGFEVVAKFGDGRAFLNYVQTNPVDVLLCDMKMPEMSGIEVARELHNLGIPVLIVFLSAYQDYEYLRDAMRFGARDYVLKPTKYSELSRVLFALKAELDAARRQERGENADSFKPPEQQIISMVKMYIENNIRTATLDEAASIVRLNSHYLSRFFREKTGLTFSDFLTRVKMERAKQLLQDFRYRTYEVSSMVGYTDENNFSRAFRKYFGQSPREFRKHGGEIAPGAE